MSMNIIFMVLLVLIGLLIFKNLKHHLVRKSVTLMILLFVAIALMMLFSPYLNLGSVFSKDNLFAKTGAAVVETVQGNVDTSSISSFISESFSSVQNLSVGGISKPKEGKDALTFVRVN